MKTIIYAILLFLICSGVLCLIYFIKGLIFSGKVKTDSTTIVSLSGSDEDVEMIVRSYLFRRNTSSSRIIFLDNGLNKEVKKICKLFCSRENRVEVKTLDEVCEFLKSHYS